MHGGTSMMRDERSRKEGGRAIALLIVVGNTFDAVPRLRSAALGLTNFE